MDTTVQNPNPTSNWKVAFNNSVQQDVDEVNKNRLANSTGAINNYNLSIDSGAWSTIPTDQNFHAPPVPAFAQDVTVPDPDTGLIKDEETSTSIFVFMDQTPPPIHQTVPVVPLTQGNIHVGVLLGGKWYQVCNDDTWPANVETHPGTVADALNPDGTHVTGVFVKYESEMGDGAQGRVSGWYYKES